jgi:FAD/FMN-containing dehydrogenase
MMEVASYVSMEDAEEQANALIADLENNNFGYALPKIYGADIDKINELRKAGLGLLGSIVGDDKAADSEDTAVELSDLPNYIADFGHDEKNTVRMPSIMHAGAGEIHLRPILNLKQRRGLYQFRGYRHRGGRFGQKIQRLAEWEHGDGIVRGEFCLYDWGQNYELLKRIKLALILIRF